MWDFAQTKYGLCWRTAKRDWFFLNYLFRNFREKAGEEETR